MKTPGIFLNHKSSKRRITVCVMTLLILCFTGVAMASSEGEGEAKGWASTDTYRVMNFSVLAIGLFLLVRKPAANALNARIKGIKDQLSELEESYRKVKNFKYFRVQRGGVPRVP